MTSWTPYAKKLLFIKLKKERQFVLVYIHRHTMKNGKHTGGFRLIFKLDHLYIFFSGLLDHVTVLIGLAVNGKAVGGVIHQPYYNYQVKCFTHLKKNEILYNESFFSDCLNIDTC